MGKFLVGIVVGVAFAIGYVHFNLQLPEALRIPERLKGNLISTATENLLYNLHADRATRQRALEVYFAHRAADAARLDAKSGHPFLSALVADRARREARQVSAIREAADMTLSKPELRSALERRHGTRDAEALKRAMLLDALEARPFLKSWIEAHEGAVTGESLPAILAKVARDP